MGFDDGCPRLQSCLASHDKRNGMLLAHHKSAPGTGKGPITMNEQHLRDVIEDVKLGRLSRRAFIVRMIGLGLTAPLAAQMLASSGVAVAANAPAYAPTKRGGGGALKVLWWQGPTLL